MPTYLLGLLFSISWIDAATPVDYRLLSPLFVPLVVLGAVLFQRSRGRFKLVVPVITMTMLVSDVLRTPAWVWQANHIGARLAYASVRWERSRVMKILATLPPEFPIWTNVPDATALHASRVDSSLPSRFSRDGTQVRDDYRAAIAAMRKWIAQNGGAVVLFEGPLRRSAPKWPTSIMI